MAEATGAPRLRGLARTHARAHVLLLAAALLPSLAPAPLHAQTGPEPSPGERLPVREVTLDNGMRFLILPRPGAPTVSFVLQFGIGGIHEPPGRTGLAHLVEHMLFKGTTTVGTNDLEAERRLFALMDAAHDSVLEARAAGDTLRASALLGRIEALEDSARAYTVSNELDRILGAAGAQGLNATTSAESTIYFVELPSARAELWFLLEADRMANPVFREFYAERNVVLEERRMRVDASPGGLLYERHLGEAFRVHPYGRPVVGYERDLERLGRRDVRSYFERYYTPGNAVAAIVGAVDPDEMEDLARRYFGPLRRGEPAPPVTAVEPPQAAERRIEIPFDAEPLLRIGWHVPSALDADGAAVEALASLLTGGRSSRLYRRLVLEDRLATSVFSSIGPGRRHPGLLQIDVTPRSPHTPEEVEAALYEEIARLVEEGPTANEVERVRNQVRAGGVRRMQSNLGLAFQLAESESLWDDWRETFRSGVRLDGLTTADLRRVAARYLRPENRTVAILRRPAS